MLWMNSWVEMLCVLQGFTAGGFIYISVAGVMPDMHTQGNSLSTTLWQLTSMILGMGVAVVIALAEWETLCRFRVGTNPFTPGEVSPWLKDELKKVATVSHCSCLWASPMTSFPVKLSIWQSWVLMTEDYWWHENKWTKCVLIPAYFKNFKN